MAKNLKLIRLYNGEDILGDVIEITDKTIKVKDAVRVVIIPSKVETSPGVALAPFSHWTSDKEIDLYTHVVMAVMNPITEFANQYNAIFGGIVVADNKIILPGQE